MFVHCEPKDILKTKFSVVYTLDLHLDRLFLPSSVSQIVKRSHND